MVRKSLAAALLTACVSGFVGCTHAIREELRKEAVKDLTFTEVLRNPDAHKGALVIWGGSIIKTINHPKGTTIIALEVPLGPGEQPKDAEDSLGRFIAKTPEYLDPAVYRPGRKITVAGDVVGSETGPVGKTTYKYPVVAIRQIHVWRRRPPQYTHEWYPDEWSYPYGYWPYDRPYFAPGPFGDWDDRFGGEFGERGEGGEHGEHDHR